MKTTVFRIAAATILMSGITMILLAVISVVFAVLPSPRVAAWLPWIGLLGGASVVALMVWSNNRNGTYTKGGESRWSFFGLLVGVFCLFGYGFTHIAIGLVGVIAFANSGNRMTRCAIITNIDNSARRYRSFSVIYDAEQREHEVFTLRSALYIPSKLDGGPAELVGYGTGLGMIIDRVYGPGCSNNN